MRNGFDSDDKSSRTIFKIAYYVAFAIFGIAIVQNCKPAPDKACEQFCNYRGEEFTGNYKKEGMFTVMCYCRDKPKNRLRLRSP